MSIAKFFNNLVFHEALPSNRKTGAYMTKKTTKEWCGPMETKDEALTQLCFIDDNETKTKGIVNHRKGER